MSPAFLSWARWYETVAAVMSKRLAMSPAVMRPPLSRFSISRRTGSPSAFMVSLRPTPLASYVVFRKFSK